MNSFPQTPHDVARLMLAEDGYLPNGWKQPTFAGRDYHIDITIPQHEDVGYGEADWRFTGNCEFHDDNDIYWLFHPDLAGPGSQSGSPDMGLDDTGDEWGGGLDEINGTTITSILTEIDTGEPLDKVRAEFAGDGVVIHSISPL